MRNSLPPPSCKVCTPKPLAVAMIRAIRSEGENSWLEPSVGRGVFLNALAEYGVSKGDIRGIDLDPVPEPADARGRVERGIDFLTWSSNTAEKFNCIVGNPPYLPILTLPTRSRCTASAMVLPGTSTPLSARANLWSAFLCGSVRLLARGGAMSFVLPAAWDYADYAAPLREHLPRLFGEFYVLRCRTPLFDEVQEGSVVLVGRKFGEAPAHFHRRECATNHQLISALCNIGKHPRARSPTRSRGARQPRENETPLRDILEIRLGGVTGDANYFLLTEAQRLELSLPSEALRPVLSKAHHLAAAFIGRDDWKRLRDSGERVWLFRPPNHLLTHPKVSAYLDLEANKGGCNRSALKVQIRDCWHRTPLPRTPDGFMSGMSQSGPWLALSGMPGLSATNTLYTIRFQERLSRTDKAAWALSFLSTLVRNRLEEVCRVYAAGLKKFEPGDLYGLRLPRVEERRGASERYARAVDFILEKRMDKATALADEFLGL